MTPFPSRRLRAGTVYTFRATPTIPRRLPPRTLPRLCCAGWAPFGRFPGRLRRPQPRGRPWCPGLVRFACTLQGFGFLFFFVGDSLRFVEKEATNDPSDVRSTMLRYEIGALALGVRHANRKELRSLLSLLRSPEIRHGPRIDVTPAFRLDISAVVDELGNVYASDVGAGSSRTHRRAIAG